MTGQRSLVRRARRAGLKSYSPYSGFRVGAALLAEDGTVYTGTNVENAAYPVSSCAEVTAVNHAVAEGVRKIDTVAVVCLDADSLDDAYPCGGCRQVMHEFGVQTVLVAAGDAPHRVHTLSELLPHGFSGETLLA